TLKINAQTELHNTAPGVVRIRQIPVSPGRLAEARTVRGQRGCNAIARREQQEVSQIEHIERLHPELHIHVLTDVSLLGKAEVPFLLPGSIKHDALAQLTGLIRGPDV